MVLKGSSKPASEARGDGSLGRLLRTAAALPAFLTFAACQSFPQMNVGAVREVQPARAPQPRITTTVRDENGTRVERLASPPTTIALNPDNGPETSPQIATLFDNDTVRATLPPQPVPQFIDTVFNEILKVPYSMGPGVAEMRQVVAVRGAVEVDERTFFAMVEMALRDYGVSTVIENGVVRLTKNETLIAGSPQVVRSRSMPETPDESRAVIQFFELQSVEAATLKALLDEVFPNLSGVKVTVRSDLNSLVIVGRAREVQNAAQIIAQFDQPRLAGAQIARVEPVFMSPQQLADAASKTLQTEGYQATTTVSASAQRAVTFMVVPNSNQILVFSNIPDAFERALYWVRELDRPVQQGDQVQIFIYNVKNTSAEELGRIAAAVSGEQASVIGSAPSTSSTPQQRPQVGGGLALRTGPNGVEVVPPNQQQFGGGGLNSVATGARITVDSGGNRILFKGTASEFERARNTFVQLDTPPLQVLIEITIAEVTLSDETRFGLEWFADKAIGAGLISGGTEGGLGLGAGGLTINYNHSTVTAALNAFASNNNINVLSSPRVVSRSGGEANIQVGTDVPVITSQRAAGTQVGGDTDILQTVQYRKTGVILNVQPVVFGDRVQLQIMQEVSSQADNSNQAIGSPLILNRSINTELTVQAGSTAVIGGLMQDSYTRGNTGIPGFKDLPFVGSLFRTDKVQGDKTELLMLVTPHIIRDGDELADAADFYSSRLNTMLDRRGPHAYTLSPWRPPFWSGRDPQKTYGEQLAKEKAKSGGEPPSMLTPAPQTAPPPPVAPAPATGSAGPSAAPEAILPSANEATSTQASAPGATPR